MASTRTDLTISRPGSDAPTTLGLVSVGPVLRALADPMRAAILELLAAEQQCTCHLQEALGAKQTLVSHHLRLLREAGLVQAEPSGRFTYYRLIPGAFDAARNAVTDLAAVAGSQLPKRPC